MSTVVNIPFVLMQDSIVFNGRVNGKLVTFVLDTGDAVGPVFNARVAKRLGLPKGQAEGVSGAGGASSVYETQANVELGDVITYDGEIGAIDSALQGYSLLGLPWFLDKADDLNVNFSTRVISFTVPDAGTPTAGAEAPTE